MRAWWVQALRATIVVTAVAEILRGDVPYGLFCLVALAFARGSVIVARQIDLRPPVMLELVLLSVLVGDMTLGSSLGLYVSAPGYDKLLHVVTAMLLAGVGAFAMWRHARAVDRARGVFEGALVVLATLGIGALWELSEYTVDRVLGRTTQSAPGMHALSDTMADLGADLVGAVLGVALAASYVAALTRRDPRPAR